MKHYIEVDASKELPEDGIYHVISKAAKDGSRFYEGALFENGEWQEGWIDIEFWLKEVELPGEEEIEEMAAIEFSEALDMSDEELKDLDKDRYIFIMGAKAIIKLMG